MRACFILFVLATGCATDTSRLEARIHDLEIQVAELRGRASVTTNHARVDRITPMPGSPCVPVDNTVPMTAQFPSVVAFDLGHTDLHTGDHITIREVHGTQPEFAKDGMYVVRGDYTLASADEAILGLNVQGGCTQGNTRGRVPVKKGSGTFELATKMAYVGQPHVGFYVNGEGSGGVFFGKGDFLYK